MVGHNQIKLNQSQMIQATEYYLKEVIFKDPKFTVVSVVENKSTGFFEINLDESNGETKTEE
jgi:hypothetical protein